MEGKIVAPGDIFPPEGWWDPAGIQFAVSREAGHSLLVALEEKTERLAQAPIPREGPLRGRALDILSAGRDLCRGLELGPLGKVTGKYVTRLVQWRFALAEVERKLVSKGEDHPRYSTLKPAEAGDYWRVRLPTDMAIIAEAENAPFRFPTVCVDRDDIPFATCAKCLTGMGVVATAPLALQCQCPPNTGRPVMAPWHSNGQPNTLFHHPYGTRPRDSDMEALVEYLRALEPEPAPEPAPELGIYPPAGPTDTVPCRHCANCRSEISVHWQGPQLQLWCNCGWTEGPAALPVRVQGFWLRPDSGLTLFEHPPGTLPKASDMEALAAFIKEREVRVQALHQRRPPLGGVR